MSPGKLEITTHGPTGRSAEIKLDGHEISNMVARVELSVGVSDINVAVLMLMPGEVEVDGEAIAEVKALLKLADPDLDGHAAGPDEPVHINKIAGPLDAEETS